MGVQEADTITGVVAEDRSVGEDIHLMGSNSHGSALLEAQTAEGFPREWPVPAILMPDAK